MSVRSWVQMRLPASALHLDVAACGRPSLGGLRGQVSHLLAEAEGGYVAEAAAEQRLQEGRTALASMVGLAGTDVAFCESASAAFELLMTGWPLGRGARIGTAVSEFGGNAAVLARLAAERSWTLVPLPVDALGRIQDVPADLDLVTFPQVASHRGIEQPVGLALASGVPLLLDVAQALGQCPIPTGAAAYVGTSRKWLCGPRGVGFLLVDPATESGLRSPPTLSPAVHDGVRRFESAEATVAGRVGLAIAASEWIPSLRPVIHARAARMRAELAEVPGWSIVEPTQEPTGMTTLRPEQGQDPAAIRLRLLDRGIVVSAVPASRAAELARPVLRISTAAWVTDDDGPTVRAALAQMAGGRI